MERLRIYRSRMHDARTLRRMSLGIAARSVRQFVASTYHRIHGVRKQETPRAARGKPIPAASTNLRVPPTSAIWRICLVRDAGRPEGVRPERKLCEHPRRKLSCHRLNAQTCRGESRGVFGRQREAGRGDRDRTSRRQGLPDRRGAKSRPPKYRLFLVTSSGPTQEAYVLGAIIGADAEMRGGAA